MFAVSSSDDFDAVWDKTEQTIDDMPEHYIAGYKQELSILFNIHCRELKKALPPMEPEYEKLFQYLTKTEAIIAEGRIKEALRRITYGFLKQVPRNEGSNWMKKPYKHLYADPDKRLALIYGTAPNGDGILPATLRLFHDFREGVVHDQNSLEEFHTQRMPRLARAPKFDMTQPN